MSKNLCVIGTGYVGLVGAAVFADWGNKVVGVDIDAKKIKMIEDGKMPIFEPGLAEVVLRNIKEGRLSFTTKLAEGVKNAEIIFICVGTPQDEDGSADLTYVLTVAEQIAELLTPEEGYKVVVTKSTVPVGTNEKVKKIISEKAAKGVKFDVASNPEFLREGSSVEDMMQPDRTVVGSDSAQALKVMHELYDFLGAPIVECDLRSAEMIKYASNAFLATKISFINEIGQLCERADADVNVVAEGMGHDKRIGRPFLNASIGYGGSCFKPDTLVYVKNSPDLKNKPMQEIVTKENEGKQITTLGFNLALRRAALASIQSMTERDYSGDMIQIKTRMGRDVELTSDHPMLVFESGEFQIRLAQDIKKGDLLPFTSKLPPLENFETKINLVEITAQDPYLREKTIMVPVIGDFTFSNLYNEIKPYAQKHLEYVHDIKRYNKLPLRVYLDLPQEIKQKINLDNIHLYTVAATMVPAQIKITAEFMRYLGYYLAEGHISKEKSRQNSIRERIGITFHADEKEYIDDVTSFYTALGIKHAVSYSNSSHNACIVVSSKVWTNLLENYLNLGINSYTKKFPKFVFRLHTDLKMEILRGAFSGDGSLSYAYQKYPFIEYATVSSSLANDIVVLLQSLGVVASIAKKKMNKSKVPAYIVRISGKAQIEQVLAVFGEKIALQIEKSLKEVKYIKPIGYKHLENFNLLPVSEIKKYFYEGPVLSVETNESTVVVNSGLIVHNCFPKDVAALYKTSTDQAYDFKLLRSVMEVNELQRHNFMRKIKSVYGENLSGITFACLGLAFKADTDDIRESVAIKIVRELRGLGATLRVFDPEAQENAKKALGDENIYYAQNSDDAIKDANAICLLSYWKEFSGLDFANAYKLMADGEKSVFNGDARNKINEQQIEELGFIYFTIGKRTSAYNEAGDIVSTALLRNGH